MTGATGASRREQRPDVVPDPAGGGAPARRVGARPRGRHSVRELYFLELAVQAPDEDSANALELYAYEAYKDALAITEEHDAGALTGDHRSSTRACRSRRRAVSSR